MAGSYPDVPAPRMAYDLDGTVGVMLDASAANPQTLTSAQMKAMNDDSDTTSYRAGGLLHITRYVCLIFPELRDLAGYFAFVGPADIGNNPIETSVDTTNGVDGTWTQRVALFTNAATSLPSYRTSINALAVAGVKSVRFSVYQVSASGSLEFYSLHLYGSPSTVMGTADKLVFWHPTLDQPLGGAALDFGNTLRGTIDTRTFRVKNCSPSRSANSVALSIDVAFDTSPTVASQHTLSTDGATFTPTVNLGSLTSGQISGVVTLRRSLLANAALSIWSLRVPAIPASWS